MIPVPINRYVVAGVATVAVAAGGLGFAAADKVVTIDRGGQMMTAHTFRGTVADVLRSQGITVDEHDTVSPPLTSTVREGETITVDHAHEITVTIDGKQQASGWTTADSVGEALTALHVTVPQGASVTPATGAPVDAKTTVTVTTPKPVTVVVAGKPSKVTSTAATVNDLLAAQKISVGAQDQLKPAASAAVTSGMTVTLNRVTTKTVTKSKPVAYPTKKVKDATLYADETKTVTAGKAGASTVTVEQTFVNGKLGQEKVVATKVTTAPQAAVVKVGTKKRPGNTGNTSGINLAREAMWDRIARCESGNRWNINTGNGYYGGLQFAYRTWLSAGGGQYAPRADLATREQQITIANRLFASQGTAPWGCA